MTLLEIALYFMVLSIFSVGGLPSVMPEMQRYVVEVKGWMSPAEFMQAFAVGQAAPGPNMLITSLVGWHVAGLTGALVALAAMCGPAAVLAWWVAELWDRFKGSPWRTAIQRAIARGNSRRPLVHAPSVPRDVSRTARGAQKQKRPALERGPGVSSSGARQPAPRLRLRVRSVQGAGQRPECH